jgi:hypothetical protein
MRKSGAPSPAAIPQALRAARIRFEHAVRVGRVEQRRSSSGKLMTQAPGLTQAENGSEDDPLHAAHVRNDDRQVLGMLRVLCDPLANHGTQAHPECTALTITSEERRLRHSTRYTSDRTDHNMPIAMLSERVVTTALLRGFYGCR